MDNIKYIVYKEDKFYVSQAINFEVSSFGGTIQEAIENLKEAVALYLEDYTDDFPIIPEAILGEYSLHA